MSQPKVSVLMPNFNGSKYLEQTIKSVLEQTYDNFEFIIIDDGSTDNSLEVIRNIKDNRIICYELKKNEHICYALNYGLSKVTGKYIARIDSDDCWHKTKLEEQIKYMEENSECGACFTWLTLVDEDGNEIPPGNAENGWFNKIFRTENMTQSDWLRKFFFDGNCLCHPSVVIRKSVIDEIGDYNYSLLQIQDLELWIRIVKKYPIYVITHPLLNYRSPLGEKHISNKNRQSSNRMFFELEYLYSNFFNNMDEEMFLMTFRKSFHIKGATEQKFLECEKLMLLLKCQNSGIAPIVVAIKLFINLLQNEETRLILRDKYGLTQKDLYNLTTNTCISADTSIEYTSGWVLLRNLFKKAVKKNRFMFWLAKKVLEITNIKIADNVDKNYQKWIKKNEKDIKNSEDLPYKPLISVVVPVYNVLDYQLKACINSVLKQTYENRELILVDDASTWKNVRRTLKKYENKKNITVIYREQNGHISRSTNDGIDAAKGEYVALLDCDDIISPNAIYEITKKLNENPEYDFIYTDEDKITENGRKRFSPLIKPDWSPDMLMSAMYTNHFSIYRKKILDEIGKFRVGFEGAQDYDVALRFTEKTDKVAHIAKILYHWRARKESIAFSSKSKPYVWKVVGKIKEEALNRRGLTAHMQYSYALSQPMIRYINANSPKVSIIILAKDKEKLKNCIESIDENTSYSNYEIIIVDINNLKCNKLYESEKYTYISGKATDGFSKLCNLGVKACSGEVLLFLDAGIEICDSNWMDELLGYIGAGHTGAVSCRIIHKNSGSIYHNGIIGLPEGPILNQSMYDNNFHTASLVHNYLAVTKKCLMVRREKFYEAGGFDEELKQKYQDIDLCLGLLEHGYYNVVVDYSKVYYTDTDEEDLVYCKEEQEKLFEKHPKYKKADPFYTKLFDDISGSEVIKLKKKITKRLIRESDKFDINSIEVSSRIRIFGWAFIEGFKFNQFNNKHIILIDKEDKGFVFDTAKVIRQDVVREFGKGDLILSGFEAVISRKGLDLGEYKVGIMISNKIFGKKVIYITDKKVYI